MRIVFRTDASLQIGSGHVMRCLTLADELRQRGAEVGFICREHPGHLLVLIEDKGYPVVRLPQAGAGDIATTEDDGHAAWLGVTWERDAAETVTAIGKSKPEWLIVDHYALDRRWEELLRPHVGRIMVIDDLADRPHDCELLLDQNLYQALEKRYDHLLAESCTKLLGPRYSLLRPEFAAARKGLRRRNGEIKRVLVFFGSVDPTNETVKALQAMAGISDRQFEVDVIVGGGNPNREQIETLCAADDSFHYHCQVNNMAELMAAADLAVGAGGTATWERCALGLPSIVTAVADNQKELAETGAQNGLHFYMGEALAVSTGQLLTVLRFTLSFPTTMQYYSANCLSTVDGKGAGRAVNFILPQQITIRRATLTDCDSVYEWRNAEETRRYIFNDKPISLETHRNWYRNTLHNSCRVLLIGEIDSIPVGVLRYDLTDDEALISIYLVPGGQGQGVGSQLIRCGSQWMRENYPGIRVINAEIFSENKASLRAFESAGYKEHHLIFQEVL